MEAARSKERLKNEGLATPEVPELDLDSALWGAEEEIEDAHEECLPDPMKASGHSSQLGVHDEQEEQDAQDLITVSLENEAPATSSQAPSESDPATASPATASGSGPSSDIFDEAEEGANAFTHSQDISDVIVLPKSAEIPQSEVGSSLPELPIELDIPTEVGEEVPLALTEIAEHIEVEPIEEDTAIELSSSLIVVEPEEEAPCVSEEGEPSEAREADISDLQACFEQETAELPIPKRSSIATIESRSPYDEDRVSLPVPNESDGSQGTAYLESNDAEIKILDLDEEDEDDEDEERDDDTLKLQRQNGRSGPASAEDDTLELKLKEDDTLDFMP